MEKILLLTAVSILAASLRAAELPADVYPGIRDAGGNLLPSVAAYLGQEVRSLTLTVDPALLSKRNNFGYTAEEIQKYFSTPIRATLDEGGMDKSFLKPVPAPGVHPRVIFNPEDVPVIRNRLAKTQAGRAASAAIRSHILEMLTGPKAKFAADYNALAAGQIVENLDANVPYTMMYEAFRCLIDDDKVGGKKVARRSQRCHGSRNRSWTKILRTRATPTARTTRGWFRKGRRASSRSGWTTISPTTL